MSDQALSVRRRARFVPRTIRGLALAFAVTSAVVTTGLGLATYGFVHEELERQIDHRLEVETRALVQYERAHGFEPLLAAIRIRDEIELPAGNGYLDDLRKDVDRATGYIVLDPAGTRRAGDLRASMPPLGWSEFIHFRRPDGTQGVAQGINTRLPNGAQLLVAADRSIVNHMDSILFRLFAVAFGILVLIAAIATLAFARIVRSRLQSMEALANAIIAGDIAKRLPFDGSGVELDRLSLVLNRMLDRISDLVANLREVSSGLAHDLRTPLSRLRSKLERAEQLARDDDQRALLEAATNEADDLLDLFAALLAVVEVDGKAIRHRFVPVDLAEAVREIAEAHRPALEDAGLKLHVSTISATIQGDRALLQRLVANLLDNALVHAFAGNSVTLTMRLEGGNTVVLRVEDDGPGVPPEYRQRIFDRLIRLDPSRSRPGHGLGLSMVATIASAHDGTVAAVPGERGLAIEFVVGLLSHEPTP